MRGQGKKPSLALVAAESRPDEPASIESPGESVRSLSRGVHKERSSYAGYVAFKAVADDGSLTAHIITRDALSAERTVHLLWDMIYDYEALRRAAGVRLT